MWVLHSMQRSFRTTGPSPQILSEIWIHLYFTVHHCRASGWIKSAWTGNRMGVSQPPACGDTSFHLLGVKWVNVQPGNNNGGQLIKRLCFNTSFPSIMQPCVGNRFCRSALHIDWWTDTSVWAGVRACAHVCVRMSKMWLSKGKNLQQKVLFALHCMLTFTFFAKSCRVCEALSRDQGHHVCVCVFVCVSQLGSHLL